jgi:ribonuclease VapC
VNESVEYVFDATALIALVESEPGYQRVQELVGRSTISAINVAEAVNKFVERGSALDAVQNSLRRLELLVVDWSEEMAYQSAEFTRFNQSHGLSLGDRACLTLARRLHATAVTSDRTWKRIPSLGVPIMIFR